MTEREEDKDHEAKAAEVERDLDEMEERAERLHGDIEGTRDDWESKQADERVPGAVGREEEDEDSDDAPRDEPEDDDSGGDDDPKGDEGADDDVDRKGGEGADDDVDPKGDEGSDERQAG